MSSPTPSAVSRLRGLLKPLADLRITVVLLALGSFLVFAGTLAQVNLGIWSVVNLYFHSVFVWIPLDIFLTGNNHLNASLPFPGGWTIGGLLLINLIAAFVSTMQWRKDRAGLLISHFGIILMLSGEIVTATYADEGNMSIEEGSWSDHTEDIRHVEIFFTDHSAKDKDVMTVIPDRLVSSPGVVADPLLPAKVEILRFMRNSRIKQRKKTATSPGGSEAIALPEEGSAGGNGVNMPSVYVRLTDPKTGKDLGQRLLSTWIERNSSIKIDGKEYEIGLRFRRKYRPFRLHLVDFTFKRHTGTNIPASFSSKVRLEDPTNQVDREVLIWMNHPLRYQGETFYQASFRKDERGTVLQVVRNPGWLIPYISCILVSIGLLLHFMTSLARFLRKRSA